MFSPMQGSNRKLNLHTLNNIVVITMKFKNKNSHLNNFKESSSAVLLFLTRTYF